MPEMIIKETLPCVLTPLGFHLSGRAKEKTLKGNLLIYCHCFLPPRTCLQAFCIYAAILSKKHPHVYLRILMLYWRLTGLVAYSEISRTNYLTENW